MDEFDKFIGDVALMRFHQRNYFKTRDKVSLQQSKKYEKLVDDYLKNSGQEEFEF